MIKAIVFDLDGLLVQSEPLWRTAEQKVFSGLGLELDEKALAQTTGIRLDEVVRIRFREHPWTGLSLPQVERDILDELEHLIREKAQPCPGAAEAISFFTERGLPLALASSSPMRVIRTQLGKMGWLEAFHALLSAEDDSLGKPYPGVYLRSAKALGVDAHQCLALEDSLPGLIAAKAAGMTAIAVPDPDFAGHPGFGLADQVLDSLEALDQRIWDSLMNGPRPFHKTASSE